MAPRDLAVVLAGDLTLEAGGWVYRGERPGPGWYGHGYTTKRLAVLVALRLVWVEVHKQRWRDTTTGQTRHDRPPNDIPWAYYELAVVLTTVWTWMSSPRGLHHVTWPWEDDLPSRRTVQRWLARLLADALAWQAAIRAACVAHLAPSTLEEKFPTGLPPPGTVTRWRSAAAKAGQLTRGLALLHECASTLSIPPSTLLVEAQRRFMAEHQA